MNNYTYVSIIALYCYIFLFISLSASKKTKLIKAFMTLLMAMMFWTGGSFFLSDFSLLMLQQNSCCQHLNIQ